MTSVERLVARLHSELGVDLGDQWEFHRTYAGYWQRIGGAWSWFIVYGPNAREIGSYDPVGRLLRASTLELAVEQRGTTVHIGDLT